jgi:hypothetical protein
MKRLSFPFLTILLLLLACANPLAASATQMPPAILADSFFFAHVYLDSNNNGVTDSSDAPLEGAIFSAHDAYGLNGGGLSGKDGNRADFLFQLPQVEATTGVNLVSGHRCGDAVCNGNAILHL